MSFTDRFKQYLQNKAADLPKAPVSFVTPERVEKTREVVEDVQKVGGGFQSRFQNYLQQRNAEPMQFPVTQEGGQTVREFIKKTEAPSAIESFRQQPITRQAEEVVGQLSAISPVGAGSSRGKRLRSAASAISKQYREYLREKGLEEDARVYYDPKNFAAFKKTLSPELQKQIDELDLDVALGAIDATPAPKARIGRKVVEKAQDAIRPFEGFRDITTKVLSELRDKTKVDKQFIQDQAKRPGIKQSERELLQSVLEEYDEAKIPAEQFANDVKARLLPLDRKRLDAPRYENVNLPDEVREPIQRYDEIVYESPIKTRAGDVHFRDDTQNYFAHVRTQDMADKNVREVLEIQSDLMQRGRLADEAEDVNQMRRALKNAEANSQIYQPGSVSYNAEIERIDYIKKKIADVMSGIDRTTPLKPYRNNWHERIVREEVKRAAEEGIEKLRFPTGETAMEIEGLGEISFWKESSGSSIRLDEDLTPESLAVGKKIYQVGEDPRWIITDVLEDGKFKAVPQERWEKIQSGDEAPGMAEEIFDVSDTVDTDNPVYRFYEKDVAKYLKKVAPDKKVNRITDDKGVEWFEIGVDKERAKQPVEAFGAITGVETEYDEEGNVVGFNYDPLKGAAGVGVGAGIKNILPSRLRTKDNVRVLTEEANALRPTALDPKDKKVYEKVKNIVNDGWTHFRESTQDEWYRVNKLQREVADITQAKPYEKQILFHGRIDSRIKDTQLQANTIIKRTQTKAKALGIDYDVLKGDVNDYLIALHAPERNAALGDGAAGITTQEAQQRLQKIQASQRFSEIKQVGDAILDLNKKTLDVLRASQVIDDELYTTLRNKYQNHVPLNRVFSEEEDIVDVLAGRGLDVRGAGIKRAKGSERDVSDILTNVTANLEAAYVRAEKNRINLETLRFARDLRETEFADLFEEVRPRAIGETFEDAITGERKPLTNRIELMKDPMILSIREKGKDVFLRINDEALANTFKGVGLDRLPTALRFINTFTRFYSGIHTRFNLEFAFSNKVRDLQELAIFAASQKDVGFSGAAKTIRRDPESMKDVLAYMRGADTDGAKLYKQMVRDGGTTGGMSLSTRKQVEIDVQKLEKLAQSNTRKAGQYILEKIDNWNTVFEDSSRLSMYKTALEKGMSREQAAVLAKESTINFNKKGTKGPIINALYMFSNASIQGSAKMLKAMKDPKVALATISTVYGAVAATQRWNDSVDPDWRDKVTEWDKNSNLVVLLPTDEQEGIRYLTVPVSWGLKPIKVAADYTHESLSGVLTTPGEALSGILAASLEAYNPVGGTDITSTLSPTILDLPIDLRSNQAWHGGKIRPDWNQNLPESYQYWKNTKETKVGRTAIAAARMLSDKSKGVVELSPEDLIYAYEQYIGGAGRFASRTFNTIASLKEKGELPEPQETPVINRFFEQKDPDEIYGNSYETLNKIQEQQEIDRFLTKEKAEVYYEEFNLLPDAEAKGRVEYLKKAQPRVYEKMVDIAKEKSLGITSEDKAIKSLGVENGARAKYIYKELQNMDTKKKRERYADLKRKGVVSDNVEEQLEYLFKNPKALEEQ